MNQRTAVPKAQNEPALEYAPGSHERIELKKRLSELEGRKIETFDPPRNYRYPFLNET